MIDHAPPADSQAQGDGVRLWPMLLALLILGLIALAMVAWSWHLVPAELPARSTHAAPPPQRRSGVECGLYAKATPYVRYDAARRRLSSYAWVAGEPGVALIPIDEAAAAWLAMGQP